MGFSPVPVRKPIGVGIATQIFEPHFLKTGVPQTPTGEIFGENPLGHRGEKNPPPVFFQRGDKGKWPFWRGKQNPFERGFSGPFFGGTLSQKINPREKKRCGRPPVGKNLSRRAFYIGGTTGGFFLIRWGKNFFLGGKKFCGAGGEIAPF